MIGIGSQQVIAKNRESFRHLITQEWLKASCCKGNIKSEKKFEQPAK